MGCHFNPIPVLLALVYWKQVKPDDLLRFKLTGAEEELVDVDADQPDSGMMMTTMMKGVVHGLRFDKRCSKLRPMADTWSKVNGVNCADCTLSAGSQHRTTSHTSALFPTYC